MSDDVDVAESARRKSALEQFAVELAVAITRARARTSCISASPFLPFSFPLRGRLG
jgi:hypothetical protein